MNVKENASLFLCLHNNISKNLLLPGVGTFIVFREQFEDAMNLGETSYVAFVTHGYGCTMIKTYLEDKIIK